MLPITAGMTGVYHHIQLLSIEMVSWKLLVVCLGWFETMILPISSFQVVRITDVSHGQFAKTREFILIG
jgi:hypothetical protein